MKFKDDEPVLVTMNGKSVAGVVVMSSEATLSVLIRLDSELGRYKLLMPLLWLTDSYVDLLEAQPVVFSKIAP